MRRLDGVEPVLGRAVAVRRLLPDGPLAGPPVVLLHEGLGSIEGWKTFPDGLAERLRAEVILYDRLGHGRSDPLPAPRDAGYLALEAERWLPALLDRLDLDRVRLVGHSDGGTIALLFAAARPERVVSLASIAAHVFVEDITIAGIREAVKAYANGRLAQRLARQHGDKTADLFAAWADTWLAPWFRDWNVEAALPAVQAPVLVIQGEADAYGTRAQVDAIVRGVAGPARLVMLAGVGHSPHLEAPTDLLGHLSGFFAMRCDAHHRQDNQPTVD